MSDLKLMLDTNIVSNMMRYPLGAAAKMLQTFEPAEAGVSVIVVAELRFGIRRVNSANLSRQADLVLQTLTVATLDSGFVEHYASVRSELERQGRIIGANDLLIAAHALSLDLPLVTDNISEFSRVPGLRVENWLD